MRNAEKLAQIEAELRAARAEIAELRELLTTERAGDSYQVVVSPSPLGGYKEQVAWGLQYMNTHYRTKA